MEIDESQMQAIEAALEKLEEMDPSELPEPAAELAEILGRLLEELEQ